MKLSQQEKESKTIEAYWKLQQENRMPDILGLKKKISLTKLDSQEKAISSFIFGKDKKSAELVARQLLLLRLNSRSFNEQLLYSIALNEPLSAEIIPADWQKALKAQNIRFQKFRSAWKFMIYILLRFANNTKTSVVILASAFFSRKQRITKPENYVQFCDISNNCLPWAGENYTIINWYLHWEDRVKGITGIHHNLHQKQPFSYNNYTVEPARHFIKYINSLGVKVSLFFWFIRAFLISLYSLLRGKWINSLLLHEAFLAKIIEQTEFEFLAKEYLFSISTFSYRPLWTYAAEKKGSQVTNYSYASSFGGFKTRNGYVDIEYYFDMATWPRLLYWTNDYIAFMRNKLDASVQVIHTGAPIYYSDKQYTFPVIPDKAIAIFDISPVEPYVSATLIPELPYRNYENGKKFLTDIYETFGKQGYSFVWKRKRGFDSIHSRGYIDFCDEFEKLPNVIMIDPDVSAFHVIQKCGFCISMPFTSTAFVAEYYKKPSIFYDSTKLLYKDDRGAQGIPLVSGIDELIQWRKQLDN